jgi:hypothetical protein
MNILLGSLSIYLLVSVVIKSRIGLHEASISDYLNVNSGYFAFTLAGSAKISYQEETLVVF